MAKLRTPSYVKRLVDSFLKSEDSSPLVFVGWFQKKSRYYNLEIHSLDEIVMKTLKLTEEFPTDTRGHDDYTDSGKNRSVVDIWRIIKNFLPEVTIYETMKAVYRVRGKLRCQVCSTILKRVFYVPESRFSWESPQNITYFNRHEDRKDELGLYFGEWENL